MTHNIEMDWVEPTLEGVRGTLENKGFDVTEYEDSDEFENAVSVFVDAHGIGLEIVLFEDGVLIDEEAEPICESNLLMALLEAAADVIHTLEDE